MPPLSMRTWLVALALLSGCVGAIGETQPELGTAVRSVRDAGVEGRDGSTTVVSSQGDGEPTAVGTRGKCAKGREEPLADGLKISEIALYQTVKVSLYRNPKWTESSAREAPVVQGKKALVRVFVTALDDYEPRLLRAVLTLRNGSESQEIVDEHTLRASSKDDERESTFNFDVPADQLGPSTELSVSLQELSCDLGTGDARNARFPSSGLRPLDATRIGTLRVVLVPVRTADGRVPLTSDAELAKIRSELLAYYPVPDVEVEVREPLAWTASVAALDGQTWSNLLNQIMRTRKDDLPDKDVYYFGLVQPAATFREYCPRGCILGLAPQTTSVMPSAQVGLGASFGDGQTYETIVHELGHAHGRGHSPCVQSGGTIDGTDQSYPFTDGSIGGWGWNSNKDQLIPPSHKDVMGYCEPNWISAYNYGALAARSQDVNTAALVRVTSGGARWHHVLLYADGGARWGGDVEDVMPSGKTERARVLDAQGQLLDTIDVVRIPLSHTSDAFLYIPEPGPRWATLELGDRRIALASIQPAL